MRLVLLDIRDTLWPPRIKCACAICNSVPFRISSSRTRSSTLINSGKTGKVLIDTSHDFRGQLSEPGVSRISVIASMHPHYDRYAGFGELASIREDSGGYGAHKTLNCILFQYQFINLNRRNVLCIN